MSKPTYSDKEAIKLLGIDETSLRLLRVSVIGTLGGKLNNNNISAMRSYLEASPPVKKKRGRPLKLKKEPYQQPCSPLGPDCGEPQKETDETPQEETQALEREEKTPVSIHRVKELVQEAYALGTEHGKHIAVNDNVSLLELLEIASCQQQIS